MKMLANALSTVSLDGLKIFCVAAEHLSFSRAAQALGISPAYVSRRMQALESELDTRLFHRNTRQISLTEQGEQTLELALQVLTSVDVLHDQIARMKNEPGGVLRVSTSFGFGRRVVAECLAEFAKKHPAIQVRLDVFDHVVDLVRHRYDVDVRVGDVIDSNYIARKLADNYRVLCAAPSYLQRYGSPDTVRALRDHDCLVIRERDHPVGVWKLTSDAMTVSIKVDGKLVTNNGEIAVGWALDGHGIVLRSIWDVFPHLQSGRLQRVLPAYRQDASIWAVYPERLGATAKVSTCVMHMEEYFRDWQAPPGHMPG
ncbi:LysR family transcriptional regulator [Pusillimonas sp. MFBS29]|uniref:LysR substrate-binding domain-containing protein n=1 Tax=Pusillimonas sp. MFBS29 TaxID=2886690 RepID=UPI001D12FDDA|nr:LysR substrate-binding domain-containing protein [Pusillimonas sp. MFBS29]MCC2596208.1 LysR family transcriptional regulator [Pusillimonas sp. MFBS29]